MRFFMPILCPLCGTDVRPQRARQISPDGKLMPWPVPIHACPAVSPAAANDPKEGAQ